MKITKLAKYALFLIPVSIIGAMASKKQIENTSLGGNIISLGYDLVDTAYADVPDGYDGGGAGSCCSGGGSGSSDSGGDGGGGGS